MKGIRSGISPDALSDTGYIRIYQGGNRWLQSDEEPSEIAKTLIDAIKNQNDNNPVLLLFDIL